MLKLLVSYMQTVIKCSLIIVYVFSNEMNEGREEREGEEREWRKKVYIFINSTYSNSSGVGVGRRIKMRK